VEKEKIAANPAQRAPVPKAPEGRSRFLSAKEPGAVLTACPPWLLPIAGLAVSLGARRGELLRVRWEDVNLVSGQILLKHTKNGKARPAFINDMASKVLASLGAGAKKKGPIFSGVTPAQVSVAFIRACKAAGIEDFSLNDMRHTFASHLRMHGADLHDLQKLLGHSDPRMTDRYAHLSNELLGNAAKRLDGVPSLVPATGEDSLLKSPSATGAGSSRNSTGRSRCSCHDSGSGWFQDCGYFGGRGDTVRLSRSPCT